MVKGTGSEKLKANLVVRQHAFLSGVAAKLGGHDEGPDPHELIEAALAACTILTVQMYAQRKQWTLEGIDVQVKIESEGAETKISRRISLSGPLTEEERGRLLQIADKCPIHRLLTSSVTIETALA